MAGRPSPDGFSLLLNNDRVQRSRDRVRGSLEVHDVAPAYRATKLGVLLDRRSSSNQFGHRDCRIALSSEELRATSCEQQAADYAIAATWDVSHTTFGAEQSVWIQTRTDERSDGGALLARGEG